MKIFFYYFITILLLVISCDIKNIEEKQPMILTDNCEFDLEKLNFNENIPLLYSESISSLLLLDFESENIDTSALAYYPYNASEFSVKIEPSKKYGYLYHSKELKKIAKFDSMYFNSISILTNLDTIAVGVNVSSDFPDRISRDKEIQKLNHKYGTPSHSYFIGHGFNACSYQWNLNDRIIQAETFHGFSFVASSNNPNGVSSKYYKLSLLIIKKDAAQEIAKLRTLNIQDIQIIIQDDFLLNSLNNDITNFPQSVDYEDKKM